MGRWSKAKIKENALELVDALNEHLEDDDLSDLEKLKNAYDICAYHCDSSFTMRFLRRYAIDEELEKNVKILFGIVTLKFFGLKKIQRFLIKKLQKLKMRLLI